MGKNNIGGIFLSRSQFWWVVRSKMEINRWKSESLPVNHIGNNIKGPVQVCYFFFPYFPVKTKVIQIGMRKDHELLSSTWALDMKKK